MVEHLAKVIAPDGLRIILALFLSFLLGLQREEHKGDAGSYVFGGVRTFPLIGLIGYSLAYISGTSHIPVATGFAVIGLLMCISYWHKLQMAGPAGLTTEVSALAAYVIGALCALDQYWIATTLTVISLFLLELKEWLESLSRRIPSGEILTFTKFLLLTVVILPVLPNQAYGPFQFNPFKAWLVVAAVSAVSYASYILEMRVHASAGVLLSAVLGGLYSSTVVTIVLAKRSRDDPKAPLYSGGILIASSVMYLRLLILVAIFNLQLARKVMLPFVVLTIIGTLGGWVWARRTSGAAVTARNGGHPPNPLELRAALLFGLLFVVMLALTHYAIEFLGTGGVYGLALLTGFTDVAPFIMGLTQTAGYSISIPLAAAAIVVAAASNNVIKAGYAYALGEHETAHQSLAMLLALTILSLVPLIWLV